MKLFERAMWCWAIFAFRAYLALPSARDHSSRYGRLTMWLLEYAGMYAHTKGFAEFCQLPMFNRPTVPENTGAET